MEAYAPITPFFHEFLIFVYSCDYFNMLESALLNIKKLNQEEDTENAAQNSTSTHHQETRYRVLYPSFIQLI